jgi:hypothetical protein
MREAVLSGGVRHRGAGLAGEQPFAHGGQAQLAQIAHRRDVQECAEVRVERALGDTAMADEIGDRNRPATRRLHEHKRLFHVLRHRRT